MLIIGHRGASAYKKENTMSSFKEALKMNADGVECDIRLSKDKKLAVIHDETIDRTTSGRGYVKEYNMKTLKKYKIPELKDLLKFVKSKNKLLLIEIKEKGYEKKILETVLKEKMSNNVLIVSFIPESLKKVKKLNPHSKTGLIFAKLNNSLKTAKEIKADWTIPRYHLITKKFLKYVHKKNLKVLAWTVNDFKLAKKLSKLGVDAIATNNPGIMIPLK